MAEPPCLETSEPSTQTPLLDVEASQEPEEEEERDTHLDQTLQRLETFLCFFGFHQSSVLGFLLSWFTFLLLGVSLPVLILELSDCSGCENYQIFNFELDAIVAQSCLAAVSLACASHNLRKYGIREFLFVDRYHGHMLRFRKDYIDKIEGFFRLLVLWILPCFILKTVREVIRTTYVHHASWWRTTAILLALILSWIYLTTISFSACVLFNLVCNLQVIHFDDYAKLLERDSNVSLFIKEHIRLRFYLSKISHRFRIYLLLVFLVVTASQFVFLFQTTGYKGTNTFINGGDLVVSSIVQVVGIYFCLHGAAKISHRAQGIASVACRWHALISCCSTDAPQLIVSNGAGNLVAWNPVGSLPFNFSESDLESLDSVEFTINTQFASYMSTYHKRQAFVMYLQSNPGGVTIFGWTVDRTLITTIFFIELSLVLFVLGKTMVL
ncbi:uncharacterized protein LOC122670911 [Telopea speciosissima]|uniref:uncharacterized protein LOC122670911 n=1 Tax=Telopea speciosissima TaxID=54955 RepID=UPI001CC57D03|nr:uncharacterized protein LOC122670911 [Telopea speciosissima]